MSYSKDDDHDLRLSLKDLRNIPSYRNVTDEEGEAILDDLLAFTRMILDLIN